MVLTVVLKTSLRLAAFSKSQEAQGKLKRTVLEPFIPEGSQNKSQHVFTPVCVANHATGEKTGLRAQMSQAVVAEL
jgi:hypothetical protein